MTMKGRRNAETSCESDRNVVIIHTVMKWCDVDCVADAATWRRQQMQRDVRMSTGETRSGQNQIRGHDEERFALRQLHCLFDSNHCIITAQCSAEHGYAMVSHPSIILSVTLL